MCFTVHCQKCGQGRILASGYIADVITTARMIECLKSLGWQFAPRILCCSCACPMDAMEMVHARELFRAGKMMDWLKFRTAMEKKYAGNHAVGRWFDKLKDEN